MLVFFNCFDYEVIKEIDLNLLTCSPLLLNLGIVSEAADGIRLQF